MISEPYKWVEDFAKAGADQLTFHYEADVGESHEALCESIRKSGMKVGLSVKPKTELSEHVLSLIEKKLVDMVLIMTVEPGFGG